MSEPAALRISPFRVFPSFWLRPLVAVVLSFVFASTVCGQATPTAEAAQIPDDRANFHLFLLVGQSNMAGRGKVEAQDLVTNPKILMLTKENEWAPAKDPLHFDKPTMVGTGLGRTFALDYAKANPSVTIGLIPCAVGGSSIAAWQPGGYHSSTKTHPWDDMLPRAKLAMKSGTLKGILWHQGESDSNEKQAPVYEQKLTDLITRFRSQLNAKDVPFIAGQMGQFAERPWNEWRTMVDAAQQKLPETVPAAAFVRATGLNHKGDQIHFDSAAYRELGHRYFLAYQELTESKAEAKNQ